jgi:Uma2 family endonuclease
MSSILKMMQSNGPPTAKAPASPQSAFCPYRFRVDQYEKMIESGVFSSADRVELIEGIVVQKMTQYPPHAVAIDYTLDALRPLLPEGCRLREQKPIQLSDSKPEPDLVVVRGPLQRYEKRHPGPRDIALLIEVADTTLEGDRQDKGRIYARARIAVYWIVNLNERQVEVYTEPKSGKEPAYRRRTDYASDAILPLVIEGAEVGQVAVSDLLPSRHRGRGESSENT